MRGLLRVAGIAAAIVIAVSNAAVAHPLGNFTVNHLSRITVAGDDIGVRYVLDMAEIPAFSLDRSLDPRGTPPQTVLARWAREHAVAIAPQLHLVVDGRSVTLNPVDSSVRTRPGAGGLPTILFTAWYTAHAGAGPHHLVYRDETEPGRLGWKDVVTGTQPEPTAGLTSYPSALVGSPRARVALAAAVDAAGRITADANTSAAGSDETVASPALGRSNALSDILAKGSGDPLVVIGALLLAIALGALHALEPGHGKTLLAVSLVGARATTRQAVILATALTFAHTAGVLVLGAVVLGATRWIVPEQIYPWITLGSGLFITVLGARAVAREVRRRLPHAHAHAHAHPHAQPHAHDHVHAPGDDHHAAHHHVHGPVPDHVHAARAFAQFHAEHAHDGEHTHDHANLDDEAHARAHAIPGTAPLTFRSAVIAAASGNVAPCPAALVVLLAAIALHQVGYGLALIVAFSIGLAAVLTVLGVAVVRSAAWLVSRPRFDAVARFAPLVTACVIALVGAVMVAQGFVAQGLAYPVPVVTALVVLAIAGYAFAWHGPRRFSSEAHA
jgi:nickel/cobalt transporter (NicO) family protein